MKDYKRDDKGRFQKGTPQPNGFGKGKQKDWITWNKADGSLDHYGHRIIYVNGKRARAQRHIWEQTYGEIPEGYVVHHINEQRDDNRIENLMCISRSEHNRIHRSIERMKHDN